MKTHPIFYLLFCTLPLWMQAQSPEPAVIPGQYIVVLKETAATPVALQEVAAETREQSELVNQPKRNANLAKLSQLRRNTGVADDKVLAEYADALVGFSARLSNDEAARLAQNPDVEGVYPDYSLQLEIQMLEEAPGELAPAGQTVPCAITNAGGFKKSTSNNWIWILDTGIDIDHPDLSVGDIFPYAKSFIPGETYDDGNGHGTHVAGIAAAKNNSFGIVGVSAGALVIPVKVLSNSGMASFTYLLQGINHVAIYDKYNDVVNLSLGAYPISNCANSNPALRTAITNLGASGTWVCIAAGNDAGKAINSLPGCINGEKVFTVGGMTCAKGCYSNSNWGNTVVDWVATAVNVYSTYKGGGYATLTGTSQATPVVAGLIHSLGGPPTTGGTVSCGNQNVPPFAYKIAKR